MDYVEELLIIEDLLHPWHSQSPKCILPELLPNRHYYGLRRRIANRRVYRPNRRV